MSQFELSIEALDKPTYRHGFHLGTIERTARECAKDIFRNANEYRGNGYWYGARTVALILDGKLFDVWDGVNWSSEYYID